MPPVDLDQFHFCISLRIRTASLSKPASYRAILHPTPAPAAYGISLLQVMQAFGILTTRVEIGEEATNDRKTLSMGESAFTPAWGAAARRARAISVALARTTYTSLGASDWIACARREFEVDVWALVIGTNRTSARAVQIVLKLRVRGSICR